MLTLSPYGIKYVPSGILLSYIKSYYYKWVNLVPCAIYIICISVVFILSTRTFYFFSKYISRYIMYHIHFLNTSVIDIFTNNLHFIEFIY